jgi:hypothetical protein
MLVVDFEVIQNCDCSSFRIVDLTNFADYPMAGFTSRQLIITYADGTQDIITWALNLVLPAQIIATTKDVAVNITLTLTPVGEPDEDVTYTRDKNVIISCKADKAAKCLASSLSNDCDKVKVIASLNDIDAGVKSAQRLGRMNFLSLAQDILDRLNDLYEDCDCGCS